jgi:hypothetical protein
MLAIEREILFIANVMFSFRRISLNWSCCGVRHEQGREHGVVAPLAVRLARNLCEGDQGLRLKLGSLKNFDPCVWGRHPLMINH